MLKLLTKLKTDEEGATAIEYGLIAGLISVVCITAAVAIGPNLQTLFDKVSTEVATGAGNAPAAGDE
jgi:pilus assembly protein Flp/PilA